MPEVRPRDGRNRSCLPCRTWVLFGALYYSTSTHVREGAALSKQAMPYARRPKRLGLHAALAVAVTGAALAIPVDAAVAMPTDYVKQVKADSGDTLTLDGNTDTVTVKDPSTCHGCAEQAQARSGAEPDGHERNVHADLPEAGGPGRCHAQGRLQARRQNGEDLRPSPWPRLTTADRSGHRRPRPHSAAGASHASQRAAPAREKS